MTGTAKIRRILVALDSSPQSLAALEAAVQLAANLGAKLRGIFVEDINLVRLAGLPMVHEVGAASGRPRDLSEGRMVVQLRGQAARAERILSAAAGQAQVQWSFRVARGSIESELLEAASDADLVILGRAGWSGKRRLGSTAKAVVSAAPNRTLVVEAGEHLSPALMVVYDGSERSRRALDTAITLGRGGGGYLVVGIVAENSEQAREKQREVAALLAEQGLDARYRWLIQVTAKELAEMVHTEEECILILPGESPLLKGKSLPEALEEFRCPVLLVQ